MIFVKLGSIKIFFKKTCSFVNLLKKVFDYSVLKDLKFSKCI